MHHIKKTRNHKACVSFHQGGENTWESFTGSLIGMCWGTVIDSETTGINRAGKASALRKLSVEYRQWEAKTMQCGKCYPIKGVEGAVDLNGGN